MAAYRRVDDLSVTCRLTACTPGSALGPTLGVENGNPLPLPFYVDNAKCIVVTRVRVSVCLCVCVSVRGRMPTLLHGPGCNLGNGMGCPLVVHYWAVLQSVNGLRCYGNITRTRNVSEYMLVLALCLVLILRLALGFF